MPLAAALLCSTVVSACLSWTIGAGPATADVGHLKVFPMPDPTSGAGGITAGPGRNVWFAMDGAIGRITHAGKITEYPLHAGYEPGSVTTGPDGNLWFAEWKSGGPSAIGRMTPGGTVTDFVLANGVSGDRIAGGPDGNVWFTASGHRIGRITPGGSVRLFDLPTPREFAIAIAGGPDGNVWFTEGLPDRIAKITPAGQVTEFDVPGAGGRDWFGSITAGPDGNVWFTNAQSRGWVAAIAPDGTFVGRWVPKQGLHPSGITADADGNLWYVASDGELVGRFTPGGSFAYFPGPVPSFYRDDTIALGADGDLWFPAGQYGSYSIARMDGS